MPETQKPHPETGPISPVTSTCNGNGSFNLVGLVHHVNDWSTMSSRSRSYPVGLPGGAFLRILRMSLDAGEVEEEEN